jgi:hypothetical protein
MLTPIYPVALFFEIMHEGAPFLSGEMLFDGCCYNLHIFEALNTHLQLLNIFQMF